MTAPYCDVVRGTQQVKLHKGQAELSAIFANKRVGIEIEQPVPEPKGIGRRFGPRAVGIGIGPGRASIRLPGACRELVFQCDVTQWRDCLVDQVFDRPHVRVRNNRNTPRHPRETSHS